jgi:uncharacterized membrane protein
MPTTTFAPSLIQERRVSHGRIRTYRIDSIDLLRGLIMIIMALDHTRDFFHGPAWLEDPLNMATTTPILFFTRWITHFCAPVFVFLAGTSAYFQSLRKSKKELSSFLIKRGLWLILIEVTVVGFAFTFDPSFEIFALQTIWSIGMSMVILGLMVWLPFRVVALTGLVIVFGHNFLDFYESAHPEAQGLVYDLLHRPGIFHLWGKHNLLILYPFLPWAGLMMTGYGFGKLFCNYEGNRRKKILAWTGLAVILFFIALRWTNLYGDPDHWAQQKNAGFTFLSFINTHKYPPSLLYMCMTIGPALLFLAFVGNAKSKLARIITVYGRVPFFYYVLHFYLIHFLAMVFFLARGHSMTEGLQNRGLLVPKFINPGEGVSLGMVYLIWIAVVVALYPACKWFSDYKMRHKSSWLSYL